jgi:hypothetical protein
MTALRTPPPPPRHAARRDHRRRPQGPSNRLASARSGGPAGTKDGGVETAYVVVAQRVQGKPLALDAPRPSGSGRHGRKVSAGGAQTCATARHTQKNAVFCSLRGGGDAEGW